MTLVEFLLARIAEDYAVALRQAKSNAEGRASWEGIDPLEGCTPEQRAEIEAEIAEQDANGPYFVQVVTPERYLLECEAKRRIIEQSKIYEDAQYPDFGGGYQSAMEDTLDLLGLPYADHPDYRAEWRP